MNEVFRLFNGFTDELEVILSDLPVFSGTDIALYILMLTGLGAGLAWLSVNMKLRPSKDEKEIQRKQELDEEMEKIFGQYNGEKE